MDAAVQCMLKWFVGRYSACSGRVHVKRVREEMQCMQRCSAC